MNALEIFNELEQQ